MIRNQITEFLNNATIEELYEQIPIDVLKLYADNGMLEPDRVQMVEQMKDWDKYLPMHKNKIWQDKKGGWGTYFYTDNGRIQKVRKKKSDLYNDIVKFYKMTEEVPTIEEVFYEWLKYRRENCLMKKQTYDRYERDFKRFFVKKNIHTMKIKDVNNNMLEDFILKSIYTDKLSAKAWSKLKLLLYGVFWYAERNGHSDIDIRRFIEKVNIPKKAYRNTPKDSELQVFTDEELSKLVVYLKKEPTLQKLGVLIAAYTGMRVGEITALKYEDICDNYIHVRRTQVDYKDENHKTVYEIQDETKTDAGTRKVILLDETREIIEEIKKLNYGKEYLFEDEKGIKTTHCLNMTLYRACDKVGIKRRSMHVLRKKFASILANAGVPGSIIISQMGHTNYNTTKAHYIKNDKTIEEMIDIISRVLKI